MKNVTYFLSEPNPNQLPYFNILKDIRMRLVLNFETTKFPKDGAEISSRIVEEITGFEMVEGIFIPAKKIHHWNYDKNRELYIDLTLDQYGNFQPFTILPSSTDLLRRENIPKKLISTPELDQLIESIVQSILEK